jgi:hypothetical protein
MGEPHLLPPKPPSKDHLDLKLLSRTRASGSARGVLAGLAFTALPARHVHIGLQSEKIRIRR